MWRIDRLEGLVLDKAPLELSCCNLWYVLGTKNGDEELACGKLCLGSEIVLFFIFEEKKTHTTNQEIEYNVLYLVIPILVDFQGTIDDPNKYEAANDADGSTKE